LVGALVGILVGAFVGILVGLLVLVGGLFCACTKYRKRIRNTSTNRIYSTHYFFGFALRFSDSA
jgi:hypothetical protein